IMLPAGIGHEMAHGIGVELVHQLDIAALQTLGSDRPQITVEFRPPPPIPLSLHAEGLWVEDSVYADAIIVIGDRTDAAVPRFRLDVVHHGRAAKLQNLALKSTAQC